MAQVTARIKAKGKHYEISVNLDEALKVTSSPGLSADLKTVLGPDCLVV